MYKVTFHAIIDRDSCIIPLTCGEKPERDKGGRERESEEKGEEDEGLAKRKRELEGLEFNSVLTERVRNRRCVCTRE